MQRYYLIHTFLQMQRNRNIDNFVIFYLSSPSFTLSDKSLKKLCPSITDIRLNNVVSMLSRLKIS